MAKSKYVYKRDYGFDVCWRVGHSKTIKKKRINKYRYEEKFGIELTQTVAEEIQRELQVEADKTKATTISIHNQNLTFGEYLYYWWDLYVVNLDLNTQRGYRNKVSKLAERVIDPQTDEMYMVYKDPLGEATIKTLHENPSVIAEFISRLQKKPKNPPYAYGLAPRTVKHHVALLNNAVEYGITIKVFKYNVLGSGRNKLKTPKVRKPKRQKAVSGSLLSKMIKKAEENELGPAFRVAAYTFLRRSELLGLRWCDISLDEKTPLITIDQTLHEHRGQPRHIRETLKTDSDSIERVMVSPRLKEYLIEYKKNQSAVVKDFSESTFVFCDKYGQAFRPNRLTKFVRRLADSFGRPDIKLHTLRHAAASNLIDKGVDPKRVMEMLGHSRIDTTMEIYNNVQPANWDMIGKIMDDILDEEAA